jgi:hypothetical protein
MGKVIVSEFVSLDGVMEDPGGAEKFEHGGWTMPYGNEEIGKFKFDELFLVFLPYQTMYHHNSHLNGYHHSSNNL